MIKNLKKLKEILTDRELFQLGILFIAIITMSLLQALGVASVMPFIGLIMDPDLIQKNQWLNYIYTLMGFQNINQFIVFTGLAMFILIILANVVSALATRLNIKFGLMLNHRLSKRLLEKYLYMPYVFFLNRNSADLINKVLHEVNKLTSGYVTLLLLLITRCLVSAFIVVMLLLVNVWASLTSLILIGCVYALIYWRANRSLEHRGRQQAEVAQSRLKAVSEAFGGIKEIKVANREVFFIDAYSNYSLILAQLSSWHQVIAQLPRFVLEAVAFGGIILFVLFLMLTQQDARQVIPLASLFAFAGYRLMPALQEIFTSATTIKFNQAILDRVHRDITNCDVIGIKTYVKRDSFTNKPIEFNSDISLAGVTFNYMSNKKPVLSDISLSIKRNTKVAFVGPTGSGKTTLADIILGLLIPQEGTVSIDGNLLTDNNIAGWHSNLGYVSQHIYLSDDTITNNIAFGIPENEINYDAVKKAARIANIHDFIDDELPNGYETLVGERGIRLSGGQRQRIGIARALYHDPAVLVFDEATSALDGVTEEAVLEALDNAAKSKTLIIIAHRLATVINCDMIYLVDDGNIAASGSYNELITSNKKFCAMAKGKNE